MAAGAAALIALDQRHREEGGDESGQERGEDEAEAAAHRECGVARPRGQGKMEAGTMTDGDIVARLMAQGEARGSDLATLRALAEEASEAGARRALARLGLSDEAAHGDLAELRELLRAWRDAKRSAWMHYDPARDYQTGAQHALRDGAGRIERKIELPATLDAAVARGAAERALARQLAERARLRVTLPWQDEAPPVGAQVMVASEAGVWRVTGWQLERMVTTLELVRTAMTAPPALAATPGRAAREEDVAAGPTLLAIAEMPLGPELASSPRLGIAAGGGAGWRGAVLSLSSDSGASWCALGRVRAGTTMGSVEMVPIVASAALVDRRSAMVVQLSDATRDLADADAVAIDAGANLALAGDELIQFELAVPLGGGRWRLSALHRGRRATEAAIEAHVAGEPFVLVEPGALVAVDVAASAIGGAAVVLATGAGDAEAVEAEATLDGRSLLPPAPVHLRAAVESGGVRLSWIRRSRIGWGWHDGVDAPLGEESERYRITIARGDGVVRQVEVETPSWLYAADELAADMLAGPVSARVRQCGTHGLSRPAVLSL